MSEYLYILQKNQMEFQNFWQIECQNIRPIEVQIECKDIWRRISDCQNLLQIERQKIWESDSKSGNISGYMSRRGWWYRTLRPDIHYSAVFAPPFSFHTLPFSLLYRICGGDLTANGGTSTSWLSHGFLSFTSSAWTTLALSLRWSGGCSESFSRHSSFKVQLPPIACVFCIVIDGGQYLHVTSGSTDVLSASMHPAV